ncbi:hypothetical protein SBOR_5754 [Sclerotinia borealis F-4128]|uniref:Uncharacterized protein n=1 Tax=Sclerotinia borealis (strain F-4128) TaxID=1432307 RepID=W9CAU2_SCLBF|nr:hypothetical protein SBOR_5754 [Sclerotinia borealis F-4128]
MASWLNDDTSRRLRGSDGDGGNRRSSDRGSRGTGRQSNRRSVGSHVRGRGNGERGLRNANRSADMCWELQNTGNCIRGSRCRYSHESSNTDEVIQQPRTRPEETLDQREARSTYSSWKRLIKSRPRSNDIYTIESLWQGALDILDGEDRDSKQMVPRDLENDDFFGREHIKILLEMTTHTNGAGTFVKLVQPFLDVMTHQALLDCLSIDTCVGNLYNFISGSNGSRAIPFFQTLVTNLLETHYSSNSVSKDSIERTLIAISTCLRELVRRERRALFHDDLPGVVTSLETSVSIIGIDRTSAAFAIIPSRTQEIQGLIARAQGLLHHPEEQQQVSGVSTTAVQSTYPREIILPHGRHDNDHMDITDIKILPTEEEIRSEAMEFLPSTDLDQPHFLVDHAARLLDTHFRLLRHDIFGELKSALGGLILAIETEPSLLGNPKFNDIANIRAHSYLKAQVADITFNHRLGLKVHVSFAHPPQLTKKSPSERRKWWDESKRLAEGVLLCLLSFNGTRCSPLFLTVTKKSTAPESDHNLVSHKSQAIITAKLATQNPKDFESLTLLNSGAVEGILVELPGVILSTFTPILENLQDMQRLNRFPFRQWILPDRRGIGGAATLDVPPPLSRGDLLINTSEATVNDASLIDEIEQRTELDRGQSEALLSALLREFCHIQGPPGTGKSFLGVRLVKVLLACKTARLGPIIIVCYTNHALDQFLEHLVQSGIEKVIRIGGQSKSVILEGKNLRVVSQCESTTRPEARTLGATYSTLKSEEEVVGRLLRQLNGLNGHPIWKSLKDHVALHHPQIFQQFRRFDEDGFEAVGGEPFDLWLKHDTEKLGQAPAYLKDRTIDYLIDVANFNVHALFGNEKVSLARHWAEEARKEVTDELLECITRIEGFNRTIQSVYSDVNRRVLQGADIIGVTTTGLATKMSTLRHVKAKVIVCEEAGEVLEAHMLSALLQSQVGAPYKLDRSQFERLSVGEPGRLTLPIAQLNIQRRMRPNISRLIKTIYPRLVDHDVTKVLPSVVGMRESIYWLDHKNFQDNTNGNDAGNKSHSNIWEVEMTAALVRHIVRQGVYSSSDITVLTPYSGQLQKLRNHMRKEFEIVLSDRDEEVLAKDGLITTDEELDGLSITTFGDKKSLEKKNLSELLRIATVDNFQGEEAKVVIVSLVRSNKEKNVGFLRTTNRINVLLSRAQHGLYLIGNSDTYSSVRMWKHVLGMLGETDSVGKSFALCCPRHPDTNIQVFEPDDFARWSPEGGCELSCNKRLPDYLENIPCSVLVEKEVPDCGHTVTVTCSQDISSLTFSCPTICDQRVDLLEMKLYKEIDLGDTPIIVLACGHFFTAESLDGMVGMSEVYQQDIDGNFTAINTSHSLASSVPQCPDCQCPLRQYATLRYNRVINRAVIDEMSKRFLVSGQVELRELDNRILKLEQEFEISAPELILAAEGKWGEIKTTEWLKELNDKSRQLEGTVKKFCERVKDKHQPATKLHDAMVTSVRQRSLEDALGRLLITEPVRTSPRDRRIAYAGTGAMLRVQTDTRELRYLTIADKFPIARKLRAHNLPIKIPGGPPDQLAKPFFRSCLSYIALCRDESLPRLAVEGILYYAKIALLNYSYTHSAPGSDSESKKSSSQIEKAKALLDEAKGFCGQGFQNANSLLTAVEELTKLLGREWYEEVTKEELDAIKKAMVSGSGGIATHSGHWYECERGHPFAIGECGMPMEEARCPECGASIGGQDHQLVEGVTRAENMER